MPFLELAGREKNLDRAEQAHEGLPPELRGQADSVWAVRSGAEGAGGVARFGEAPFMHTGTAGVQLRKKEASAVRIALDCATATGQE